MEMTGIVGLIMIGTGVLLLVWSFLAYARHRLTENFGMLCLFGFSLAISILIMKNQELAMQVSLLNQENESILQELMSAKEQKAHE